MTAHYDPTCVALEAVLEMPVGEALNAARRALLTLPGVDEVVQPAGSYRLEAVSRESVLGPMERIFVEVSPLPEGARVVVTSQSDSDPDGVRDINAHHVQMVMGQLKAKRVRIAEAKRRNPTPAEIVMIVVAGLLLTGWIFYYPRWYAQQQKQGVDEPVPRPPFPAALTVLPKAALELPGVAPTAARSEVDAASPRTLLERGWFSALEARLAGLERDYLVDPRSEHRLWAAYAEFQDPDEALALPLTRWRRARPASVEPWLASALWGAARANTTRRRADGTLTGPQIATLRAEERDAADGWLARARELRSEHLVGIGASYFAMRRDGWDRAQRRLFEELRRLHPGAFRAHLLAIENASPRHGGSFDEMARLATEAQQQVGRYPWMRGLLAAVDVERSTAARGRGEWAESFEAIQAALAVAREPEYLIVRGDLWLQAGDPVRAVLDAGEALALHPDDRSAMLLRATALYWAALVGDAPQRRQALEASRLHFERLAERHPLEAKLRDRWVRYIEARTVDCAKGVAACARCIGEFAKAPMCLTIRASAGVR